MTTQAGTEPPRMRPRHSRFERLARWAYTHRRRALLAWVAVLVGVTATSSAIGGDYHNDFSLPGTESQQGLVITGAAAIMLVVFGAFVLSPDRMLQQFGLRLVVAILLDAVVIWVLIVPAVMRLLGERAWWLPRRLRRRVPAVALERA